MGFIAVLAGIGFSASGILADDVQLYLIVPLSLIFISSSLIQWRGAYRARHFYKEDALLIHDNILRLTGELRDLSSVLHQNYHTLVDLHSRVAEDGRFKRIMQEMQSERLKCYDLYLENKLRDSIESERIMAKFHNFQFSRSRDLQNQAINNYINTRLRSRPVAS
jgi:hypothetical protein